MLQRLMHRDNDVSARIAGAVNMFVAYKLPTVKEAYNTFSKPKRAWPIGCLRLYMLHETSRPGTTCSAA